MLLHKNIASKDRLDTRRFGQKKNQKHRHRAKNIHLSVDAQISLAVEAMSNLLALLVLTWRCSSRPLDFSLDSKEFI